MCVILITNVKVKLKNDSLELLLKSWLFLKLKNWMRLSEGIYAE